jgi:hypothetical protein
MSMYRRRGVVCTLVLTLSIIVGLALVANQADAWIPVMCGGRCINLICIPPAPPSTACIQWGAGCGSMPGAPDCTMGDIFSPL